MTRPRSAEFSAKTKDEAAKRANGHCERPLRGSRHESK